MNIKMNDSRITTIPQLKEFLKGAQGFDLSLREASIGEKYTFINQTVRRLKYWKLNKKEKHLVLRYIKKLTGYGKTQSSKLVKKAKLGQLVRKDYHRTNPHRTYTAVDIKLLEKTDELHVRLSEGATKEILRREYQIFNQQKYQTIFQISHSHITNLRHSSIYQAGWINHTKARQIPIGSTMKPENYGKPGSIRVDTVHQRDVYHINSVDEITQWEVVVCVPQISELYMLPALNDLISQYPFLVFNFHSDRGGENINHLVADLLHRLLIKQTKTRSRHPNDNALVETKNGSVIRKNMGWEHIHQSMANQINDYYRDWLNPYLNYHRPCAFPTVKVDQKGKQKKVYNIYKVPYEALKSISGVRKFLKPGITFEKLDQIVYQCSDNQFAEILRREENKLFKQIRQADHRVVSH